jgi:hypothetical protein
MRQYDLNDSEESLCAEDSVRYLLKAPITGFGIFRKQVIRKYKRENRNYSMV